MASSCAVLPAFVSPESHAEIDLLRRSCAEFVTDQQRYYYEITGFRYLQEFADYALPQLARIAASRVYLVFPRVAMDEIVDNLIDRESWTLRAPSSWHPSAADVVLPFDAGHPHAQSFSIQHRVWCQRREVFFLRAYYLYLEDHSVTLLHPLWEDARTLAQAPVPSVHAFATRINMTPRYI